MQLLRGVLGVDALSFISSEIYRHYFEELPQVAEVEGGDDDDVSEISAHGGSEESDLASEKELRPTNTARVL